MKKNDLTGKIFGKLKVVSFDHYDKKRNSYWKCICECGKEHIARGTHLYSGGVTSCGCKLFENNCKTKTTWFSKKLYKSYQCMTQRCLNKNNTHYKDYGGRGICVCKEWLDDSQKFNNWSIENGYKDGLTIDRIDVNGDYSPKNCRWVDMKIQNNNKRNNVCIEYMNKKQNLQQWLDELKIPKTTLRRSYKKTKDYVESFNYCLRNKK